MADPHATFVFTAELWEWDARDDSSWVFATVPLEVADEIRDLTPPRRGFGSVRVEVRTGHTRWRTSVFPDARSGSYVLPVKKAVRVAEALDVGEPAEFELAVLVG